MNKEKKAGGSIDLNALLGAISDPDAYSKKVAEANEIVAANRKYIESFGDVAEIKVIRDDIKKKRDELDLVLADYKENATSKIEAAKDEAKAIIEAARIKASEMVAEVGAEKERLAQQKKDAKLLEKETKASIAAINAAEADFKKKSDELQVSIDENVKATDLLNKTIADITKKHLDFVRSISKNDSSE
jgi:hypothetical protein